MPTPVSEFHEDQRRAHIFSQLPPESASPCRILINGTGQLAGMERLLEQLADAEAGLRRLGVLRSRNIVGDLAEYYACGRLDLARAPASQRGYDATDREGRRVQIKGIRLPNRQLGVLRDLDKPLFDRLVAVVLGERYEVRRLLEMSREEALAKAMYQEHVRGWTLTLGTDAAGYAARPSDREPGRSAPTRTDPEVRNEMRDRIVAALQRRFGVALTSRRRTLYQTPNGRKRACILISKRYEYEHQTYWYGYHPIQHEFLRGADEGTLVLGCMDRDEGYTIPVSVIDGLLPKLNETIREAGKRYWHVLVSPNGNGGLALYLPKAGEKRDLRPFAFPLDLAAKP
jgi:hypothetical protein